MFLSIFLFFALLAVAGSAAYFSIIGLAKLFSGAALPVIVMASSLEFGKIIITSYLYNFWKETNLLIKAYTLLAIISLVGITSLGISGYLISAYQVTTISAEQQQEKLQLLTEKLEISRERLKQINEEIAAVGDNYVTAKQRLMQSFSAEIEQLNSSIPSLESEILVLRTSAIENNAKIGPIIFITDVFGINSEKAILILIAIIVLVFDPFAIVLTIAFNKSVKSRLKKQNMSIDVAESTDVAKFSAVKEYLENNLKKVDSI